MDTNKSNGVSRHEHGFTLVELLVVIAIIGILIPQKYLSSATSGITVEVKPGDNEPLVFDLADH